MSGTARSAAGLPAAWSLTLVAGCSRADGAADREAQAAQRLVSVGMVMAQQRNLRDSEPQGTNMVTWRPQRWRRVVIRPCPAGFLLMSVLERQTFLTLCRYWQQVERGSSKLGTLSRLALGGSGAVAHLPLRTWQRPRRQLLQQEQTAVAVSHALQACCPEAPN